MTDTALDELGPVDYLIVEFPVGASNSRTAALPVLRCNPRMARCGPSATVGGMTSGRPSAGAGGRPADRW